jgi:hypothetical protein
MPLIIIYINKLGNEVNVFITVLTQSTTFFVENLTVWITTREVLQFSDWYDSPKRQKIADYMVDLPLI